MKNPNLRHCQPIPRTKEGLRNSREVLAGCRPAHPPPEAGGRGERKGANSAPETASPTKLQTGFQSQTKDFLRFWMVDIHQEGCSQRSAPRRETRHTGPARWKLRLGLGGGKSCCTWGECTNQAPGCLSCSDWGRHKTQAQPSLCLCGVPKNLNLSGLGLGSARNSGPAPCRATWSLTSVDRESTHTVSRGKPSVAGTLRVIPTHASDICLQCPSLPTARLNK